MPADECISESVLSSWGNQVAKEQTSEGLARYQDIRSGSPKERRLASKVGGVSESAVGFLRGRYATIGLDRDVRHGHEADKADSRTRRHRLLVGVLGQRRGGAVISADDERQDRRQD
jgi:hypothetical protein